MKPRAYSRSWIGAAGVIGYVLVLVVLAPELGLGTVLRSSRDLYTGEAATVLGHVALLFLLQTLAFVPLGFLAAFAFGSREGRLDRLLRVWIPALAVSLLVCAGVVALEIGGVSPLNTVLPWLGGVFGVVLGVAWSRGPRARRRLFLGIAALAVLAVVGLGLAVNRAIESAPLTFEPTLVTGGERRRVYRQFEGKNPQTLPEGKTAELVLTARDLNVLLAWGLSLGHEWRKAQLDLDQDHGTLSVSVRLPGESRYLNAVVGASARIENGKLQFRASQWSVGRLDAPSWLLRAASFPVARILSADARVRPVLTPIRSLDLGRDGLRIVYGHADLPSGFVASLFQGEGAGGEELPVVRAHVRHLLDLAGTLPRGEERFGRVVEAAFDYARMRSKDGQVVRENRGAVLALGILLGHWRVQNLVGPVLDEGRLKLATKAFKGVTLRNRSDWPKHFFVSASLTLVSNQGVSDQTGILKEELDADGGSGFSFGDLTADRAGTTFAQVATRDDASARAIQGRLERGFQVDDFFPPASDLPEDLTDAEFQARFGGVGGAGYNRLVAEIEKRVAGCAAYAERDTP